VHRSTRLGRFALAATFAACAAALVAPAAGAVSPTPPHIVVTPNNVMVNTKVKLVGTGFPAHAKLTIKECGATTWVVTQHPCDSNNTISVLTDAQGRFAAQFKVELCPRSSTGTGPITRETCYIGNPRPSGVDTIRLVGAGKVIVTYP
jgi:hypothetical protein